jgi:protein arginine kinase activator
VFSEGSEWQAAPSGGRICESCGEEPATVHVLHFDGEGMSHAQVCQSCAEAEAGQVEGAALVLALPALFSALVAPKSSSKAVDHDHPFAPMCGVCGTTLGEFRESGLFGCAACYQVFHSYLEDGSEDEVDDALAHMGKTPSRVPGDQHVRREVVRLRRMLSELVESERFEEAAGVRDRLAELEGTVPTGTS